MTAPSWDLSIFFSDQSISAFLGDLRKKMDHFQENLELQDLKVLLQQHQDIELKVSEASSYIHCLLAQNVHDNQAQKLQDEFSNLNAAYKTAKAAFDQKLNKMPLDVFEQLLDDPYVKEVSWPLKEKRLFAEKKLSAEKEAIINSLSIDGFEGWSELYHNFSGALKITCAVDGQEKILSVAQAANYLTNPSRKIRQEVFKAWEKSFNEHKDLFAALLNHIAGFRLKTYALRKWDSFLEEPLMVNRMEEKTLDAMWNAIDAKASTLAQFLACKAKNSGLDKLAWYDVEVASYTDEKGITYEDAKEFIVEQFYQFSPSMGSYAKAAFNNGAIEAEDRMNKRPGGFCTSFPLSKTSRIFMTWANTRSNLNTLAHELGHGFHNEMLFNEQPLCQDYPMNLAEAASTFAEQIIFDGLLANTSQNERVAILEERAIRSVLFLMNIRCRFLFEKQFYEKRKSGLVDADTLSHLMEEAQKAAFANSLSCCHPLFWASKQHFYLSGLPFYNFPYTFGYLFSIGLFALAKESKGGSFEKSYCALLKDSGKMSAEQLAKKHLGVDLTAPHFWEKAVDLALKDAKLYLDAAK